MGMSGFDVAMGRWLRRERESRGLTAADVALLAVQRSGLGWDRSTVTRIELGQRQLLASELVLLAALYDVPVVDLLPDERPAISAVPHQMDDATVKAAHRLGVDPSTVAATAVQLWGRGLTAERDRRVAVISGESLRSRGRRRGHVTRELVEDLRTCNDVLK